MQKTSESEQTNAIASPKSQGASPVRWIVRSIIPLAIITAVFVQLLGRLDDPPPPLNDPAIRNLITLFSILAACMAAWFWICFGSSFTRRLRMSVFALSLLAVAGVVGLASLRTKRIFNFSGSLIPRVSTAEPAASQFVISSALQAEVDLDSTRPDDFPQFLGPERTGKIEWHSLARDWQNAPPRQLWRRPIGAGWSSFAIANGYAVTLEQRGSEEWVTCYELATGEPVWRHATAARHETALGGVGPRSTPTICEGKVYTLGATGTLQCLSSSGKLLWSHNLRRRYQVSDEEDEQNVMFGRSASPLIVDEQVVVPGGGPQGKAKNLVAYNRRTGELVWEAENLLSSGEPDQIAYASPTLATLAGRRQILIVNESTASGHDPATGARLWSHAWPGRSNGNASVSQAVAVDTNRVLLTKGYGGGAELLELRDARSEQLQVTSVWKVSRVLQTKFSNVVVHAGHAYGLSEGILECVTLDSGRRHWKSGRYGHGQILAVGDLLLVLSEDGELHLIELNSEKLIKLESTQALSGKTWNNLAISGKLLLLRNAEEAVCFELPSTD